jgi:1,4-dihydroxy-2-naphthoate octaprenyltransferase
MTCAAIYTFVQDGSWLFVLVSPLVVINAVQTFKEQSANALDPLVRQMAFTSLIFVILFGVGIVI